MAHSHPKERLEPPPSTPAGGAEHVDVAALQNDLRNEIDGEVRFTDGDRALYTTDASNYRQVPIGVVLPKTPEDIARAVRVCCRHGAPITHRGGGTGLAGQTCNTAVIIDSSKYCSRIDSIDPDECLAVVEPGIVLDDLQSACKPYHLRFGPDPSTHSRCTVGGMIGNNSCGVHSLAFGRTSDNVEALEIVTYDGLKMTVGRTSAEEFQRIQAEGGRKAEIYGRLKAIGETYADRIRETFPDIPRRVSGFNLNHLLPDSDFNVARALVGTEGTCVNILRAHVNLRPDPIHTVLVVGGFDNIIRACECVPRIREFEPVGCEGIDDRLTDFMRRKHMNMDDLKLMPEGRGWLLVPFGAFDRREAEDRAYEFAEWLRKREGVCDVAVIREPDEQARIWEVRESGLGATAFVPGGHSDTWPGWEDSAVHPDDLAAYMSDLLKLYEKYGYYASVYGHLGEGLIHTRIDFGLHTQEEVAKYRRFMEEAAHLVVSHGGSLSGEHGDGQARGELLPIMYGKEIYEAFREFKTIWDPQNKMNPGKLIDSRPLDVDLRLGPRFHPPTSDLLKPQFSYPNTEFSMVREFTRCVGVGKCRQRHHGTMCPSYRGTLEEKHSTRGRAHILQEMLQGDPIDDLWQSKEVWDALDLCLACKACKSECPVDVDMATYKAEFAYHHFKSRRRPRAAYSMGLIHRWSRLAAHAPWLANALTQTPGLSAISKLVAGIHHKRAVPAYASTTFRKAWNGGRSRRNGGPRVVLMTDTFNNHFTTPALHAAAEVLEAAGCRVEIPSRNICCGRPLYDFGFLDQARETLRDCMETLREPLDDGAYLVGVEPSCMATFRDELPNLYWGDEQAKRLCDRSYMLGDFLCEVLDYEAPKMWGEAKIHGHCNHAAVFGLKGEQQALEKTGMKVEVLDSGCCGMAGSFGFEHDKYEVSQNILKDKLLPMAQNLGGARLLATGYSCREQLKQATGVTYPTLAEVLVEGYRRAGRT